MPQRRHVREAGKKEQRMDERIKASGRYGKRIEEVAARTVLKRRQKKGDKKGE
ncbi:MAG TPA: hypothetical protein VL171_00125 [Verrucomicrobiae bacterium]|nr:hypothetical protein [Verrucomicrobiae bacterium]